MVPVAGQVRSARSRRHAGFISACSDPARRDRPQHALRSALDLAMRAHNPDTLADVGATNAVTIKNAPTSPTSENTARQAKHRGRRVGTFERQNCTAPDNRGALAILG